MTSHSDFSISNDVVKNIPNIPNVERNSRFCSYGLDCRRRKCVFAHFFDDLRPVLCRFDQKCVKKDKCFYIHSHESKEDFVRRVYDLDTIPHISLPSEREEILERVRQTLRDLEEEMKKPRKIREFKYATLEEYRNSEEMKHLLKANWADIYDTDEEDEEYIQDKEKVMYVLWGDGVMEDKVKGVTYNV